MHEKTTSVKAWTFRTAGQMFPEETTPRMEKAEPSTSESQAYRELFSYQMQAV